MSRTLVIKINDARLVVAGADGVVHHEPGFAVVDGNEVVTGHAAYARSRLAPRHTSHDHWAKLSTAPGSASIDAADTAAELAFAQLKQSWEKYREGTDSVVLVVPNDYSNESLGVLLGLAQECGMPVTAMVDAAVAASVRPFPDRQLLYVDVGLHALTVTPIEQSDEATSLTPQRLEVGLAGLLDAFARRVAELFVLETRFDPLHDAAAEQQIYDGLFGWLDALRNDESVPIEIEYRGETFRIELERRHLVGAAQGFYRALQQLVAQMRNGDGALAVRLSDKVAAIPGVLEALGRLDDAEILHDVPGHSALAVLGAIDTLGPGADGQVRLYRHLPWRDAPAGQETSSTRAPQPSRQISVHASTHIVYRGVAYQINGEGVVIGRAAAEGTQRKIVIDQATQGISRSHCTVSVTNGELRIRDLSRYGTFVNERRIEAETVLRPADIIRIGSPGAELTAIRLDVSEEASSDGA